MKTFRVWLTFTQHDWVEVKAETLDDAFEVAWDWEAQNFPKGEELARLFPQIVDWNQIGYPTFDRYPAFDNCLARWLANRNQIIFVIISL